MSFIRDVLSGPWAVFHDTGHKVPGTVRPSESAAKEAAEYLYDAPWPLLESRGFTARRDP
jgi:hypothetical protein